MMRSRKPGTLRCGWILPILFAASVVAPAQERVMYGDVNGDGMRTNLDALMIQLEFLGMFACYPVDIDCDFYGPEYTPTPTPTVTPTPTETPVVVVELEKWTANLPGGATLGFVLLPAGSFEMGTNDPWGPWPAEQPVHDVTIEQPFFMAETELTQGQWLALMDAWPETEPSLKWGLGSDKPAYYVSWEDVTGPDGLLERLNALGQGTFRLPTEAEWEYACRAGTTARFNFGTSGGDPCAPIHCVDCADLDPYAWWCGNNVPSQEGAKPVAKRLPNAWGLYDMHGNVYEWCEDDWHADYHGAPADGSAWIETPRSPYRVFRSGFWSHDASSARSAYRYYTTATDRSLYFGVRLVREYAP